MIAPDKLAGSPMPCRRQTMAVLVALGLVLVQIHACGAQASVMDKDGDGVVTPEEFVEHAQAQEVRDRDRDLKML